MDPRSSSFHSALEQPGPYNELKPNDIISDAVKMSLLQKSIKGVDDLRRVYTTASTLASQLGRPITFQSFYDLLTDAATTHDNENITTKGNRGRRNINQSTLEEEDNHTPSSFIDMSPNDFLQINQHSQHSPRRSSSNHFQGSGRNQGSGQPFPSVRIPPDIWAVTSLEVKDMITLHNKSLCEKRSVLKTNMHQFYEAMGIPLEGTPYEAHQVLFDYDDDVMKENHKSTQIHKTKNEYHSNQDVDDTLLLDNLSGKTKSDPENTRQILAAKTKKKDAPTEINEETITLNGHRFRKLNMHCVTYHVTDHGSIPIFPH